MNKKPKGIIGVFTSPCGDVVASISVFEQARSCGITLLEAQKLLARRRLAFELAKSYCARVYAENLDDYVHQPAYHTHAKVTCPNCKQIIEIVKSIRIGNENS